MSKSFLSLKDSPAASRVSLLFTTTTTATAKSRSKNGTTTVEKLVRKLSLADVPIRIRRTTSHSPQSPKQHHPRARTRTLSQSSTGSGASRRLKKSSTISARNPAQPTTTKPKRKSPKYLPTDTLPIPPLPPLPKLHLPHHPFSFSLSSTPSPQDTKPKPKVTVLETSIDPRLSIHFSALEFLTIDPEPWVGVSLKEGEEDNEDGLDFGLPKIPDADLSLGDVVAPLPQVGMGKPLTKRDRRESIMSLRSCYSEGSYFEDTPSLGLTDDHSGESTPGLSSSASNSDHDHDEPSTPPSSLRTDPLAYAHSTMPKKKDPLREYYTLTYLPSFRSDLVSIYSENNQPPPRPPRRRPPINTSDSTSSASSNTNPLRVNRSKSVSSPSNSNSRRRSRSGSGSSYKKEPDPNLPLISRRLTSSSKTSLRNLAASGGGNRSSVSLVSRRPGTSEGVVRPYGYF